MVSKKQLAEIETVIGAMSKEELTALRVGINERINAIDEEEKEKFATEAREWSERARQLGLNLPDILGITPPTRVNRYASNSGNGSTGERAAPKPKYTDGKGNFWSGRGLQPKWMTIAMEESRAKGRELPKEHFLIKE